MDAGLDKIDAGELLSISPSWDTYTFATEPYLSGNDNALTI